jgi:two-component system phosphate regulon sensor histidine kinase PhoR
MGTEPAASSPAALTQSSRGHRRWIAAFIGLSFSFVAVIAMISYGIAYRLQSSWSASLRQEITRSLVQKAHMFASRLEGDHATPIADITSQEALNAGARATVVDANGRVVADSQAPIASLENEGQLPEFVAAFRGGTGVETRARNHIPVLYVAVPVAGGAVRLSLPLADIEAAQERAETNLILGVLVATIAALTVSALTASLLARR